ncbi:hypothetical protein ACP275_12G034600 [Erythranthe tilingii]
MTNTMEKQSSFGSSRRHLENELDFSLKEWAIKARIGRENPGNSRRFSSSNLKSFRDEDNTKSFRSNNMTIISSTASSPGYTLKEEIDPSTYSFTTALKALQAKTVYTWDYLSPQDGLTLHSKWNDAEKYISNPLSGEVPLECLSAKTLSQRSFRSRITMSAPLIYPSHHMINNPATSAVLNERENEVEVTSKEKKTSTTRNVGTQSTPVYLSSTILSPSIEEKSRKLVIIDQENGDHIGKLKSSETEVQVQVEETREKKDGGGGGGERKKVMTWRERCQGGMGCLSLRSCVKHRDKQKK